MLGIEQKVKQAKARYDVVIALMMPAFVKVSEAYRRQQALLRCAAAGVAAERFRRENKRWPDKIDDLVPKYLKTAPTDPFDGKPLRWTRLADGTIAYSVGPDGEDNGGARNRTNPIMKGTDIGFRLWDVDRRRQPPAEMLGDPMEAVGP
jgi:hypothetical protein